MQPQASPKADPHGERPIRRSRIRAAKGPEPINSQAPFHLESGGYS